jgi:CubicO group peptidase (beta-lactamase class C family)
VWAYNDVRINLLSLALLQLFRRPLPEVLASEVMDPIGASDTWQWHGYRNSDVVINGQRVRSVSGGAHWGGGFWWLNHDHAVFPNAPATGRCARGNAGRQLIWVDPTRDLVVVARWTEHVDGLRADLSAAIPD